jgi:hypothetical protein
MITAVTLFPEPIIAPPKANGWMLCYQFFLDRHLSIVIFRTLVNRNIDRGILTSLQA